MNKIDEDIEEMQRVIEDYRCERCSARVEPGRHACPYDEDINGIHDEDNCNCCADCEHECCMDI